MNNYINVLEIQNKYARLLIGYLLDGEVKVIYTKELELTVPFVDGDILDVGSLTKDISKFRNIEVKEENFSYFVDDIILVIPSFGLEVFEADKTTTTTSTEGKINKIDIQNVFSQINNENVPNPLNEIVRVLPKYFSTESNKNFNYSPIGFVSRYLSLSANVYTLPSKMVNDIKKSVKNAGFKVKSLLISSLCAAEALRYKNKKYRNYIYINYSEKNTSLALVSDNNVISSTYFTNGSDNLLKIIESEFKVSYEEAVRLARTFGYDSTDNSYNPPIVMNAIDSITAKYNKNNLNTLTSVYFKDWASFLLESIKILLKDSPSYVEAIPLIFVGKGLNINGLQEYIQRMFSTNPIEFAKSDVVGANYKQYINLVGAILLDNSLNNYFKEEISETRVELKLSKEGDK